MTIALQSAVSASIVISFIPVIGVPAVLATPNGWSSGKSAVLSGASPWIGLVLLVGIPNSFVSR
uniref:Photosystem II reaction center protein Z n=1 Tax=Selaginella vardei TaxID=189576 RepID=A0A410KKQ0_9TRAC|nr:photosystem II protein Z [Selaginella vardei]QAR48754.1 photosystem II protein Z [Selaginella vardei]